MKIFTYKDYIISIHSYRLQDLIGVAEEGETYNLGVANEVKINQTHDKLIKNILKNKLEMSKFINQFLQPKRQIEEWELQKYSSSYITKRFQRKEADLVYKIKDKSIYYLIEHQSTIDYNMPYRILNYCIDIIQEWSKGRRIGSNTGYPIVVPVVIYTGENKWTVPTNFADKQIKETTYGKNYIELSYNLIDINRYSKRYFLEKNSIFGYSMLIEKAKSSKELAETIKLVINNIQEIEMLLEVDNIIQHLFLSLIEKEQQKEIIQKIEEKVGEGKMNELIARIKAGDEKRLKEKEREVTKRVTQRVTHEVTQKVTRKVTRKVTDSVTNKVTRELSHKMLQKGINIKLIQEISGLTEEEIKS